MRTAVAVILAIGLIASPEARAERVHITTFSLIPGETLPPHPRAGVETQALPPPGAPVAAPAVPPPPPFTAADLLGRWTERDPAYCVEERYVVEWTADAMRVVFAGRAIDGAAVRYDGDGIGLKVERLDPAGALTGYWRLVKVDDDHVRLVETAERHGAAPAVVTTPDKLLVRCGGAATPAPSLVQRARLWWAAFLDRLWPASPPAAPAS